MYIEARDQEIKTVSCMTKILKPEYSNDAKFVSKFPET